MEFLNGEEEDLSVFMHSRAPLHTTKHSAEYLMDLQITKMDRPAKLSDNKPIENIWFTIARSVHADSKQCDTIDDLAKAVMAFWIDSTVKTPRNLILMMPCRCGVVLIGKGEPTK